MAIAMCFYPVTALAYSPDDIIGSSGDTLRAMNEPDARCAEVPLGSAVADAVRSATGSDIAIINGGDFSANLQGGQITWRDVLNVFTFNREVDYDRELSIAEITPVKLVEILEAGVSHIVLNENESIDYAASAYDGFPQISGFSFEFDVSAPVGDRIVRVTLSGGQTLDREDNDTFITIAASGFMLAGGYGLPAVSEASGTGLTLASAFARYIAGLGALEPPETERITVIGSTDSGIMSKIPAAVIVIAVLILLTMAFSTRSRTPAYDRRSK